MRRAFMQLLTLVSALGLAAGGAGNSRPAQAGEAPGQYEVWTVDQSDTTPDGSGTLYVFDGADLAGNAASKAVPEVIDLGGAARDLCLTAVDSISQAAPIAGRRPHMMFFSPGGSHAILSYVATGHVLFIEAATRTPVGCIDVGEQSHSAFPAPDGSYVLVANQNGKRLQRIRTDYSTNTFTLEGAAELKLDAGTTPSGALKQDPDLRPDNAPICIGIDDSSRFGFITLRGGGLFVVDCLATPMAIVAEYDRAAIHPTGCVAVQTRDKMYIISGAGATLHADAYVLPMSAFSSTPAAPNLPAAKRVFSHDGGQVDAHGAMFTRNGRYLWVGDRMANRVTVVDTFTDLVINQFSMVGPVSGDPAPDLFEIAPTGHRFFASLRGPLPLTGNNAALGNAVGATPGLGIFRVQANGAAGAFEAIAPISHPTTGAGVEDGVEHADPHAIAVRRK